MDKNVSIGDKTRLKGQLSEIKERIEDLKFELNAAETQLNETIHNLQSIEYNKNKPNQTLLDESELIEKYRYLIGK